MNKFINEVYYIGSIYILSIYTLIALSLIDKFELNYTIMICVSWAGIALINLSKNRWLSGIQTAIAIICLAHIFKLVIN